MLLNGVGTDKDEARAKEYFDKAASVGNPFACYQLAKLILSDEKAPPQDVEKALGYLRKAVEAENPYAAYFLGKLYEKGQHVPQNIAEAIRLYTLSAGQDNDFAAYRLGKLYLGGEGVLKDVESAIRWLTLPSLCSSSILRSCKSWPVTTMNGPFSTVSGTVVGTGSP